MRYEYIQLHTYAMNCNDMCTLARQQVRKFGKLVASVCALSLLAPLDVFHCRELSKTRLRGTCLTELLWLGPGHLSAFPRCQYDFEIFRTCSNYFICLQDILSLCQGLTMSDNE